MTAYRFTAQLTLDCTGLACPMPIVRTKKAMDQLAAGYVIEVQATDKGSLADLRGWAQNTGHQYLGTVTEGALMKHFIRKVDPGEAKEAASFPVRVSNEELQMKLAADEHEQPLVLLDVREPAEFAFNHIPGALSIPLGELEQRLHELDANRDIYVVCRSGSRSDLACQELARSGFGRVSNVVPGMSGWTGETTGCNG